jgi:hypothetical protein
MTDITPRRLVLWGLERADCARSLGVHELDLD